jgi:hypothetical protein
VPKVSPGRVQEAWAEIDRMLAGDPYLRFSFDSHRNWEDAKKRIWKATLSREAGGKAKCDALISRASGETREEALVNMVRGIP